MDITNKKTADKLYVSLDGRLDSSTAIQLETFLKINVNSINTLIFDFEKLDYVSSAGLRVLLKAQKVMNKQGTMIIKNVSDSINDVFEITGFDDLLNIDKGIENGKER